MLENLLKFSILQVSQQSYFTLKFPKHFEIALIYVNCLALNF